MWFGTELPSPTAIQRRCRCSIQFPPGTSPISSPESCPPTTASLGRIAYKTGTSYGYRDAWAIGFDGRHVVGVWVGRPDGAPITGLTGLGAAAPILFQTFDRIGGRTEPLRRFRNQELAVAMVDPAVEIAYPMDGVRVDLGIRSGAGTPLVIKIRNGSPPFTFLANGLPIGRSAFAREESWFPDGPGFVTIAVIDGKGQSDRVTVFLE